MTTNSENYHIIGFDLGHGKTALAQVMSNNKSEPEIIEIQNQKYQMTAIAYDAQRLPIIGDAAFYNVQSNSKIREFEISFKQRPSQIDNAKKQTITDFVKAVSLELKNSIKLKDKYFFIGCPSAWFSDELKEYEEPKKYKELMDSSSGANLPNVVVVPESRAAFMHALENDRFTIGEIQKGILVIDIGSSTTDLTLVYNTSGKNICEDYGEHEYDLGASLIEKEILKYAIEKHSDRKTIERYFEENESEKKRCEIFCRTRVKEEYFRNPIIYNSGYIRCVEKLQKKLYFDIEIKGEDIQKIINQPLEELNNNSWKTAFSNQLERIKAKLDKQGIQPSAILLTGGGARMNFIPEICEQVFPDSRCQVDTEPELCIARGLARWGRLSVKTIKFDEDINQFIRGDLRDIIKKSFDNYLDKLADFLTDNLLVKVVKPSLEDLRKKKIKKEKLDDEIQERAKKWLEDSDVQQQITKLLKTQVKPLEKEVQQKIDSICRNYGLENGILKIKTEKSEKFNLNVFSESQNIKADFQSLPTEDLFIKLGATIFGSVTYLAVTLLIVNTALEAILAPITGGISVIISSFIFSQLNKSKQAENLQKQKLELRKNIKQKLDQDPEQLLQIIEFTTKAIEVGIEAKIDDVRILLH